LLRNPTQLNSTRHVITRIQEYLHNPLPTPEAGPCAVRIPATLARSCRLYVCCPLALDQQTKLASLPSIPPTPSGGFISFKYGVVIGGTLARRLCQRKKTRARMVYLCHIPRSMTHTTVRLELLRAGLRCPTHRCPQQQWTWCTSQADTLIRISNSTSTNHRRTDRHTRNRSTRDNSLHSCL
jgi:hypothetical protein